MLPSMRAMGGENISTFDPGSRGGGCEEMMRRSRRPTRWRTDPPRAAAVTSASARFWSLFLLVGLWGRGRCPRSRLRWGVVHFCPRRPLPPSLHPLPPYPTLFSCGLLLRTSLANYSIAFGRHAQLLRPSFRQVTVFVAGMLNLSRVPSLPRTRLPKATFITPPRGPTTVSTRRKQQ